MPISMQVTIIGGERLKGWLARAPIEFRVGLFEATKKSVELEAGQIRADTPVLSGRMAGSIGTKVKATADGAEGEVYSTDNATRFVEFGTQQHGRAQRMFARGLATTRPATKGIYRAAVHNVTSSFGNFA
jgi:hypothetical protein